MNSSTQAGPGRIRVRLTRIAMTISMVLASTGVVITVTAPAHALVTQIEEDGTGLVSQSAYAECDAGQYLTGGGGGIKRGGRDVTLTAIIPDLATESVTVRAHTNPNAALGTAYHVVAQAICVPGTPPVDRGLVVSSTGVGAAAVQAVVATCPLPTQRVLGTGAALMDAAGQPSGELFLRQNFPNNALTTNTVVGETAFGFAGMWEAVSYAICATPPAGDPWRSEHTTGAGSDANSKTASTTNLCGLGELTSGVGGAAAPYKETSINGFLFINRISTDWFPQNNAIARAVEGQNLGAGEWYMAVYGICLPL